MLNVLYSNDSSNKNHFIILTSKEWFYSLISFLKKEIYYHMNFLVESSVIDTLNYSDSIFKKNETSRLLPYYIFYYYTLKIKLTIFVNNNFYENHPSIDKIYLNASWLERENSEMYGLKFKGKWDNRCLLLDYSKNESPLLKDFPTEGFQDIFYDFFENKLMYSKHFFTEL